MSVLSILSIVWTAVKSLYTFIAAILKLIPPIVWLVIIAFLFGLYMGKGEGDGCSCRRWERQEAPTVESFDVVSALNGSTIMVKSGRRGEERVILFGIASPDAASQFFEMSRQNLERLSGTRIRVEIKDTFRKQRKGDIIGIVYGETGVCLNIEQIKQGMVDINNQAPEEWEKIRNKAKRSKLGIWCEDKKFDLPIIGEEK